MLGFGSDDAASQIIWVLVFSLYSVCRILFLSLYIMNQLFSTRLGISTRPEPGNRGNRGQVKGSNLQFTPLASAPSSGLILRILIQYLTTSVVNSSDTAFLDEQADEHAG
jgi:hypothetical protein